MNNIYALNKEFKELLELSHDELNLIVTKINEIIAFISPLNKDSETGSLGDNQNEGITKSIDELIQEAISGLVADVDRLKNTPSGQVVTEEMWALYRNKTDLAMQKASAIEMAFNGIDLTSLAANIQAAETLVSQLSISPEKINLIASLVDDDGNLIIEPANIIAAITKDDESGELISSIKISADLVELSGSNVTVKTKLADIEGQLRAIYGEFQNVEVKDTLTGVHIKGGDININDKFIVEPGGHVIAESITLSGQSNFKMRRRNLIIELPDPRPGTIITIVNETPSNADGFIDTTPMIVTKDRSKLFIRWFESSDGVWSRASSLAEDSRIPAYIAEQMVFIQLVADGNNWYVTICRLKDGSFWYQ